MASLIVFAIILALRRNRGRKRVKLHMQDFTQFMFTPCKDSFILYIMHSVPDLFYPEDERLFIETKKIDFEEV